MIKIKEGEGEGGIERLEKQQTRTERRRNRREGRVERERRAYTESVSSKVKVGERRRDKGEKLNEEEEGRRG